MKIKAPGKLILSGEHAVVYGYPALAMAINRYTTATAIPQGSPLISFDLSDLSHQSGITLTALEHLKERIQEKYRRFSQGDFTIREVLQKPFELAQFAFGLCLEMLNAKLRGGVKIHVQSNIPIGCGMGSSAATILSIMYALAHHMQVNLSLENYYRLGLQAENMQHGYSSGLDLYVSLYGGCIYFTEGKATVGAIPPLNMYLVNTGTPEATTGECVTTVASHFKQSNLGSDFADLTRALKTLIDQPLFAVDEFKRIIRANQQLLTRIGVVPEPVQQFIQAIEQVHGAAKVCGAGSVRGEHAGIVLVCIEDEQTLQTINERFGYHIIPIAGETRGVHVV